MKLLSGAQTGVDIGSLWAAKDAGYEVGGYIPKGFLTEDGPRPEYARMFNIVEFGTNYPPRTEKNVQESDGTVWFQATAEKDSMGRTCTFRAINKHNKPYFIVVEGETLPKDLAEWIFTNKFAVINFAGSRESKCPGICQKTYDFLSRVFRILKDMEKD